LGVPPYATINCEYWIPTVVFKLGREMIIFGGFTTNSKLAVALKGPYPLVESFAWIVKKNPPSLVGIPEIIPDWLRVNPAIMKSINLN
jgi:hypothetical protein